MEKKRKNLDNLFRETLSDYELSNKKGNWELLNHLLDEKEKKKKRRKWILFICCLAVFLSTAIYLWFPVTKTNTEINKNENTENGPEVKNAGYKNQNYRNALSDLNNEKGVVETAEVASHQSEKIVLSEKKAKRTANSFNEKQNASKRSAMAESGIHITDKLAKMDQAQNVIQKDKRMQSAEKPNPDDDYIERKKQNNILEKSSQKLINEDASKSTWINGDENSGSSVKDKNPDLKNILVSPNPDSDSYKDSTTRSKGEAGTLIPNAITSQPQTVNSNDSSEITSRNNNVVISDSLQKQSATERERIIYFNLFAGFNFYGINYLNDYKLNLSPIGGGELLYPFSSKLSAAIGALYSPEGGYNLVGKSTQTYESFFFERRLDIYETTIEIRTLHKLYFPLTLYYNFSKRHAVTLSFQQSCLINTSSKYSEKNTVNGVTTITEKHNVKGYMDGIKTQNSSVSVGYKYRLSNLLDLNARIGRELNHQFEEPYLIGADTDPVMSYQLFLIIKL